LALPATIGTFEVHPTDEDVEFFRQHGYLHIERITTDEELAWLRARYDELFEERRGAFPGGYFDLSRPYDAEGQDLLPQVLMPELKVPEVKETSFFRNGRRFASALLGEDEAQLNAWGHMILKPARVGHETPWHQDEAYWDVTKIYKAVGVWMPLDPATVESGCLHFVPGSHLGEVLKHRHIGDDPAVHGLWTDEADGTGSVAVPVEPGGATFHHPRMLHYAGPNRTDRDRRAWATEFQLPPRTAEVPADRPWVDEGQRAWESRPVIAEAERGQGRS
jgi:ectoine hydroxylase-related dioxygenase (phytanoyl-CoA dioxygenase family)